MKVVELLEGRADVLLQRIKQDCKIYLDMNPLTINHLALYRGISGNLAQSRLITVRKDRRPRDSTDCMHYAFNEYFKEKFGKPYRSISVFCTGDPDIANEYAGSGTNHVIFPVGDFDYCWSPQLSDLFGEFEYKLNHNIVNDFHRQLLELPPDTKLSEEQYNEIQEIEAIDPDNYCIELVNYYFNHKPVEYLENQNFEQAIKSGNEIMIDCDKYYAINQNTYESWILNLARSSRK